MEGRAPTERRSGLKHDCSKVMELDVCDGTLSNGFGEIIDIEPENVFPLLKGSAVANGRLTPRKAVIVTQRKLGDDTNALRTTSPRLWEYLCKHRENLEARKSSTYREQPPFALFGIGEYSFAPYKIAICGLYKRLAFSLLRPVEGRPVMVDDAVYFLPCATEAEAEQILAALTGARAQEFFGARIFWDAKRYRKAHKLLKGYGEPVQFSIFRCRLDDRQAAQLRWELARILDEEDGLLILDLCPRCAGRVVTCNHKAGWDDPPPTFSVVLRGTDE